MCLPLCCVQEEIEVKKDTERQDEIKAMKLAWEAAEPGRAAKVVHASLKKNSKYQLQHSECFQGLGWFFKNIFCYF